MCLVAGQAALPLASEYAKVVGIDASEAQVSNAPPAANIEFKVGTAEATGLSDGCVDLVTVAQVLLCFERTHIKLHHSLTTY